jgi:hypothetical protein
VSLCVFITPLIQYLFRRLINLIREVFCKVPSGLAVGVVFFLRTLPCISHTFHELTLSFLNHTVVEVNYFLNTNIWVNTRAPTESVVSWIVRTLKRWSGWGDTGRWFFHAPTNQLMLSGINSLKQAWLQHEDNQYQIEESSYLYKRLLSTHLCKWNFLACIISLLVCKMWICSIRLKYIHVSAPGFCQLKRNHQRLSAEKGILLYIGVLTRCSEDPSPLSGGNTTLTEGEERDIPLHVRDSHRPSLDLHTTSLGLAGEEKYQIYRTVKHAGFVVL